MTRPAVAAELAKLGHVLGRPAAELQFLDAVPADDLRVLRRQVGQALFDADRPSFEKAATLAGLIPAAVAAKIAQTTLPALLAARVAELLDPGKAVDLAARLPDAYLADVCAAMDPSRVPAAVLSMPPNRVAIVARELGRRAEWVVIGAFLSQLSPEGLRAATAVYDGEQLLRVGFVLEDRLNEFTAAVSDDQIDAMLSAAAANELWTELDAVVSPLGADRAARYATRFAAAASQVRAAAERAMATGRLSAAVRARLAAA